MDPSLSALNFETLVVPGPSPHFWIEDVTLSSASSLTLLSSAVARPRSKENNLLLVGNTEPVEAFPALPKAPEEMHRVESFFPAAKRAVLEGKQATPEAFLSSHPERYAYLHFVTHGTASITRPLDSAVILSKSGDSYKLYARDILQHPLSADLVTISACEGAGGRAYSGEGLIGLSWAFLHAGAHNVVGSSMGGERLCRPANHGHVLFGNEQGQGPRIRAPYRKTSPSPQSGSRHCLQEAVLLGPIPTLHRLLVCFSLASATIFLRGCLCNQAALRRHLAFVAAAF